MLEALRLIPALQVIFTSEIEFTPDSFSELNAEQLAAFIRDHGATDERIYRVLPMEPTVIDRQGKERITLELSIVIESQRQLLLDGVAFVYRASAAMSEQQPTFEQRLDYLRPLLPPVVIGAVDERDKPAH
ncbi:MAG: hypothetical protein WD049_05485 [Candidatus Paceibacterota bacterium]